MLDIEQKIRSILSSNENQKKTKLQGMVVGDAIVVETLILTDNKVELENDPVGELRDLGVLGDAKLGRSSDWLPIGRNIV